MMKHYYAIEYRYGSNVVNKSYPDIIHRFRTKKERDGWVAMGNAYVGPGERRIISSKHSLVKRTMNCGFVRHYKIGENNATTKSR